MYDEPYQIRAPYQIPTKPVIGAGHSVEHTRGKGKCQCLGRLQHCPRCGGRSCVHRIFATGESYCERGFEHGCNAGPPEDAA